jgi:hypothetical protein
MGIRWLGLAAVCALALTGCEQPAASSTVASGPPGPPPPAPALVGTGKKSTADVDLWANAPGVAPAAAESDLPAADNVEATPAAADQQAFDNPLAAQPPAQPPIAPQPTSAPAADRASGPFISLSAGVAVPQLLPEGTQIGVSVDYSLRGEPRTSCRYFLVVETKEGEVPVPVKLDPRGGTFQGFLPASVRPEHQPFRARIDEIPPEGEPTRVSNSAVLATSY